MRIREETYWDWADSQLHSRSHDEELSDGTSIDVQVRLSRTELKIGEHRPTLPVAFLDDSRQLVTTFHGAVLTSNEVDKLTLTSGRFSEISTRESSNRGKMYLFTRPNGPRHTSDGLNFGGATYAFSPNLSTSYFYGQLEDIYQQHYLGLTLNSDLGNGYRLKTDLRYFNNAEDGKALYGNIDNRSYGAMTTLRKGGHGFGVGYQRMLGDSTFPTLNGFAPQPYLVNWSAVAFIKPNESSWQARYDYDFAALDLPGLTLHLAAQDGDFAPRLLAGTGADQRNLLVVVNTDKGLCGGLNSNLVKAAKGEALIVAGDHLSADAHRAVFLANQALAAAVKYVAAPAPAAAPAQSKGGSKKAPAAAPAAVAAIFAAKGRPAEPGDVMILLRSRCLLAA